MRIKSAGDAALLLETDLPAGSPGPLERGTGPAALAAAITAAAVPGVTDVVPGARTVLVRFEPPEADAAGLAARLEAVAGSAAARPAASPATAGPILIDTVYDGPDLAEVAALTGLSVAEVIARHQAGAYRVGWLGFSPGFGYLTGLDPRLAAVPRLDTPRVSVPAGSVAIAGGLAAVYPTASPGGWRLLGRTAAVLWDPEREPPALLSPGARVRFRQADTLPPPQQPRRVSAETPAPDGAIVVLQPGPLTTVQDLGRPGYGHLGVPRSGAADAGSLRRANHLVGNEPGAACLEVTLGRLALAFAEPAVVAVTGAPAPIRLTAPGMDEARPPPESAFAIPAGAALRLGAPATGLRSYLAVAGGIDVAPVLGSRSADLLSGLGPEPLRSGDRLPMGRLPAGRPGSRLLAAGHQPALPRDTDAPVLSDTVLRVLPGPRDDWFAAGALPALTGDEGYVVSPASNRTGLRLAGQALRRADARELPSEGMVTGSLQVSHDGQPILLLADHPSTGGYPVLAVVVSADIGLAAQLRPGQRVRFQLASSR